MAHRAAEEVFGPGRHEVEEVSFETPLVLPSEGPPRRIQLVLDLDGADGGRFQLFSREASAGHEQATWTRHSVGRLRRAPQEVIAPPALELAEIRARCRASTWRSTARTWTL